MIALIELGASKQLISVCLLTIIGGRVVYDAACRLQKLHRASGNDESLDVPLTADSTAECGGDAKPANLSRFFCERCHASLHTR
jgi:hypothetical protein